MTDAYAPVREAAKQRADEGRKQGGTIAGRGRPKQDSSVEEIPPTNAEQPGLKQAAQPAPEAAKQRQVATLKQNATVPELIPESSARQLAPAGAKASDYAPTHSYQPTAPTPMVAKPKGKAKANGETRQARASATSSAKRLSVEILDWLPRLRRVPVRLLQGVTDRPVHLDRLP